MFVGAENCPGDLFEKFCGGGVGSLLGSLSTVSLYLLPLELRDL